MSGPRSCSASSRSRSGCISCRGARTWYCWSTAPGCCSSAFTAFRGITGPEPVIFCTVANADLHPSPGAGMSKSEDERLAKLIRKNVAKAEAAKKKVQRNYDSTLRSETTDEDLERRDFFSEMKKREF